MYQRVADYPDEEAFALPLSALASLQEPMAAALESLGEVYRPRPDGDVALLDKAGVEDLIEIRR